MRERDELITTYAGNNIPVHRAATIVVRAGVILLPIDNGEDLAKLLRELKRRGLRVGVSKPTEDVYAVVRESFGSPRWDSRREIIRAATAEVAAASESWQAKPGVRVIELEEPHTCFICLHPMGAGERAAEVEGIGIVCEPCMDAGYDEEAP